MDRFSIQNRLREQRRKGYYRTRDDVIADCLFQSGF